MNKWGHDMGDKTIQGNKTIITAVILCACFTALPLIAFAVIVTPRIMDVLPADQYTRAA